MITPTLPLPHPLLLLFLTLQALYLIYLLPSLYRLYRNRTQKPIQAQTTTTTSPPPETYNHPLHSLVPTLFYTSTTLRQQVITAQQSTNTILYPTSQPASQKLKTIRKIVERYKRTLNAIIAYDRDCAIILAEYNAFESDIQCMIFISPNIPNLKKEECEQINCPVLLVRGEFDSKETITTTNELVEWLPNLSGANTSKTSASPEKYASFHHSNVHSANQTISPITIIPGAGHEPQTTAPTLVTALISRYLLSQFPSLDPTPSLMALSPPDQKWNVKNLNKWISTEPYSDLIGNSRIYGMKCLKGDDAVHSPKAFKKREPKVELVIDLSTQEVPYDIKDLGDGGYIKLGTQSKVVPTEDDVQRFIEIAHNYLTSHNTSYLAVHCHYGFNRTGFFVCSYLIEKLGYSVEGALEAFCNARPQGVRHQHFIDELWWRYGRGTGGGLQEWEWDGDIEPSDQKSVKGD